MPPRPTLNIKSLTSTEPVKEQKTWAPVKPTHIVPVNLSANLSSELPNKSSRQTCDSSASEAVLGKRPGAIIKPPSSQTLNSAISRSVNQSSPPSYLFDASRLQVKHVVEKPAAEQLNDQPAKPTVAQSDHRTHNPQPINQSINQLVISQSINQSGEQIAGSQLSDTNSITPSAQRSSKQPVMQSTRDLPEQPSDHLSVQHIEQSNDLPSDDESDEEVQVEIVDDDDDVVPVHVGTLMSLKPLAINQSIKPSTYQPSFNQTSVSQYISQLSLVEQQTDGESDSEDLIEIVDDDDDDDVPHVPIGTLLSLKPIGAGAALRQTVDHSQIQPQHQITSKPAPQSDQSINPSIQQPSSAGKLKTEDDKDYILYLKRVPNNQSINQSTDLLTYRSNIVAVRLSMLSPSELAAHHRLMQSINQSINARVAMRKTWDKYGDCQGVTKRSNNNFDPISGALINLRAIEVNETSGDQSINQTNQSGNQWTLIGQEFELNLHPHIKGAELTKRAVMTCSKCGGAHLSVHCPLASDQSSKQSNNQSNNQSVASSSKPLSSSVGPSKYVPPSRRSDASASSDTYQPQRQPQIRIDGLPSQTSESDVRALCHSMNAVRVLVDKQRRGWAYVNFSSDKEARAAAGRLDNHRYGGAVLHANFVDDQPPRPMYSSSNRSINRPSSDSRSQQPAKSAPRSQRSLFEDEGRVDDVITHNDTSLVKQSASNGKRKGKADQFADFGF